MARYGLIIAAILTLAGDNGSADQVPPPPQPPSHPAQVSMKADDWTLKQSPTCSGLGATGTSSMAVGCYPGTITPAEE